MNREENLSLSLPQAIEELRNDIDRLTQAHQILMKGMETLAGQLEIARSNLEILQTAVAQKAAAIPLALAPSVN
jgi:chromosome segregation ATPase